MTEKTAREVLKDDSMMIQKKLISGHYNNLAQAREKGKKIVYTFVPGNIIELVRSFGLLSMLPEIDSLQSAMRKKSDQYVAEAEKMGHSEDVCTYVKCHIGMIQSGIPGPDGRPLPEPDLLLLSYTGCFTFLKWFELLRQRFKCPVVLLQIPYQAEGKITKDMRDYIVKQLKDDVIPALEKLSGMKYDEERFKDAMRKSSQAEEDFVWTLNSAKQKPSPIDAYFGGVYYVGPIFTYFRGTDEAAEYYRVLREEVTQRIARKLGPITPEGPMRNEKFRIVVEGPPNWTHFREFWKMFYDEEAVVVASSYTKVGGVYESGFRHDPENPLSSTADYCLGCYTNLSLPSRVEMITNYIRDFQADGFIVHSVKSCNSFSAGQLLMLREIETRTGKSGGFIESDLVDSRYFSPSNIKNRLESYFQMLDQKKGGRS
ncbi:MAG: benzoyl-CoA reductase subunit B [Deltaproteobacteria bacterium]|nr:benzoyl-CoA reductase subunit B [Deltaproteobacteria bacterium]